MPNLLAMSFEGELAPSFTLHCLGVGRTLPDGWGLGYYPAGELGRNYLDATPTSGTIFVGGGGETLFVDVKVEPHQP